MLKRPGKPKVYWAVEGLMAKSKRQKQPRTVAREAARALIGEAAADPVKGEPLKVLEGWNVGTMGREPK